MRILAIADVHDAIEKVRQVNEVNRDIALVAGDYTYRWSIESARRTLEILARKSPVYYVAGNMDPHEVFSDLGINNAVQIHGKVTQFRDYYIAGLNFLDDEAEVRSVLSGFRGLKPLIILSHTPPYGTLDRAYTGSRLGSRALREFIDLEKPVLVIHGHVHEARGSMMHGGTLIVNPGPLMRGYYAIIELGESEPRVQLGKV